MGAPVDQPRPASKHWEGIASVVWAILMRRPQAGIMVQGTDHLSDRDRQDIGITQQGISAKFAREMTKLHTIVFR